MTIRPWLLLAAVACGPDTEAVVGGSDWLGDPWPSDDLDEPLAHFPEVTDAPLGPIVAGWAWRASVATSGFANNGPIYFRFDGPVDVPETLDGAEDDPVVLVDLKTGERIPLQTRFVEDPADDPFLAENTLALLPAVGHAPRSGATLAAVVMKSAGVRPTLVEDRVVDALKEAGVRGKPAVATVFTVQDVTGQLRALAADLDGRHDIRGWADPRWKRVASLSYGPGTTPGGRSATAQTVAFVDGTTEVTWLDGDNEAFTIDLLDWPMEVWEGELELLNHSGLEGRPYMSPGVAHLSDTDLDTGWILFDGPTLVSEPVPERVRVVLQVPPGGLDDAPVLIWDHGTGGTAYNAVHRRNPTQDMRPHAELYADTGVVVLSRDQPLWGQRFPLIDEGFTDGWLGFYNIANLTAMRDNHRQAGLEGHQLRHFASTGLALPSGGSVDPDRMLHLGHSLGAATAHNALAADPDGWASGFVSGSSSVFANSFLETALSGSQGDLVQTLGDLFGTQVGPDSDIGPLIAAGLGIEDPGARESFDRFHPAVGLFQWIMDPADPAAFAADETLPVTVLMGIDDWQIPNGGTRALARQLPDGTLVECRVSGYDPHHCLYGDPEGIDALETWLTEY